MTREELLRQIRDLEARLTTTRSDPLQSHSEALAISAPLLREVIALEEQLRRLDLER